MYYRQDALATLQLHRPEAVNVGPWFMDGLFINGTFLSEHTSLLSAFSWNLHVYKSNGD